MGRPGTFPKGVSGNPGGRPKGSRNVRDIVGMRKREELWKHLADFVIEGLRSGNPTSEHMRGLAVLANRLDAVLTRTELTGADGNAIEIAEAHEASRVLTEAELDAILERARAVKSNGSGNGSRPH